MFGLGGYAGDAKAEAIRNIGLLLVGLFGAPFLVWRSYVAQKQVNVAEQGQITDRINKAVEGLGAEKTVREIHETPRYVKQGGDWLRDDEGNLVAAKRPDVPPIIDRESFERTVPNLEVRVGAIYALERIAKDSLRDHIQIMEILCAYIRENSPAENTVPTPDLETRPKPRPDIQAAITIIGRRSAQQIELEADQRFRLDLRNADLSGVDFRNRDFSAAIFHHSRFEGSLFSRSKLIGTQLHGALLNHADFFDAELRGTILDLAIINEPKPVSAGMVESINMGKIYGVSLAAADLTAIDYLGEADAYKTTFGTRDTNLHPFLSSERQQAYEKIAEIGKLKHEASSEVAQQAEATAYDELNFMSWAPFDRNDLATGGAYKKLRDRLSLTGRPFEG